MKKFRHFVLIGIGISALLLFINVAFTEPDELFSHREIEYRILGHVQQARTWSFIRTRNLGLEELGFLYTWPCVGEVSSDQGISNCAALLDQQATFKMDRSKRNPKKLSNRNPSPFEKLREMGPTREGINKQLALLREGSTVSSFGGKWIANVDTHIFSLQSRNTLSLERKTTTDIQIGGTLCEALKQLAMATATEALEIASVCRDQNLQSIKIAKVFMPSGMTIREGIGHILAKSGFTIKASVYLDPPLLLKSDLPRKVIHWEIFEVRIVEEDE